MTFADPNDNTSPAFEELLNAIAYDDDYDGTYITLSGLVPTKNYLVQFLVFDPRSQGYSSWDQSYTGGTATAGPYTCINAYSLVGRWVADGTSQAFTLSQSDPRIYVGNQNIIINAIQWRMIPPPAGTLIMVK